MPKISHYELLGIKKDASYAEVEVAYQSRVMLWHPEKISAWLHDSYERIEAAEVYGRMNAAYLTLKQESTRQKYDQLYKYLPTPNEAFQAKWAKFLPRFIEFQGYSTSAAAAAATPKASVSKLGAFASKSLEILSTDGLKAVIKSFSKQNSSWFLVQLVFVTHEKAVEFQKKYATLMQDDWSCEVNLSHTECVLNVGLQLKASSEACLIFMSMEGAHELSGLMVMRELPKYIDLSKVPHYSVRSPSRILRSEDPEYTLAFEEFCNLIEKAYEGFASKRRQLTQ